MTNPPATQEGETVKGKTMKAKKKSAEEKATEYRASLPQKPTGNGHYMGKTCGFEYEDGRYRIAQAFIGPMDEILAEERGLHELIAAQQRYLSDRFAAMGTRKQDWWKRVFADVGLPENGAFKLADGWLIPLYEPKLFTCAYCGTTNIPGAESLTKHREICDKDPIAIRLRSLEAR